MAKAKAKTKRSSGSSARSHSSGISLTTNAPHSTTLIVSVVVFILGILGAMTFIPVLSVLSFWLCLAGYLLLLAGCLMKGL